ncbi:Hypothetical predicted protein [Mytilus galloprovincialis]|uniref:Retrotransposon gag domain-containing protein n=1 Tax=Mytilus galloprovincialis TaxID=29158 RepID=A0A8B6DDV5_MYTGA|nr:Hypothetical predicted protein [Mytilus galloprovincialis]
MALYVQRWCYWTCQGSFFQYAKEPGMACQRQLCQLSLRSTQHPKVSSPNSSSPCSLYPHNKYTENLVVSTGGRPKSPEPAPEPVQQIPEQQQAPAHLIQAIQPTGTVPAQSHAAVPAQPPFQNQSNQQGHFGRSKVHVNLTHYNGSMDAAQWWTTFIAFVTLQRIEEWDAILCFPFYLDGIAKQWWHMLDTSVTNSLSNIKTAFLNRFRALEEDDVGLTNLRQLENESVTEYIHRALSYNKDKSVVDKYLIKLTYRGMKEHIQQIVVPQNPISMNDLLTKAVTAEMTVNMKKTNNTSVEETIHKAISSLENSMSERLANHFQSVAAITTPPQNNKQEINNSSAYNQQMCFNPYQQPFQMPPPYMYTPVQQQSVQYRQPMQYPQQMMPQQNSYQNSRPYYANKQNEPCKGCGNVRQVVAANGNQVAVLGKIDIVVTVGSTKFTQTVHVLDQLHHTLILGFDFMKNQGAFINFDDLTLEMNKPKMIIGSISIKAGLVRTIKAVTIPKRSEINIPVSVSRQTHDSTVLLEPLESYCPALKNLVVAKCLVNVQNGKACLRLLNPTHSDIQLKAHKEIAKVSQVNIDDIYPLDDNTKHISAVSTTNIKQKDTDLHFDLSNSCLTSDEKSELSNFLQKNRSAFATSLNELGCTHLYKHNIETVPGARPVRLNPYRQPPNVRDEQDRQVQELQESGIIEPSFF